MNTEMTPFEALGNLTQLAYYYADNNDCLENAKEYYKLLEATLHEYNKLLNKEEMLINFHSNTAFKTPLASIFYGLTQEERYEFIEHIYYTYASLKEELECLIKAFEIIRDKQVDTRLLRVAFDTDLEHYNNFDENYRKHLTQEEFDLLKRYLVDEKDV